MSEDASGKSGERPLEPGLEEAFGFARPEEWIARAQRATEDAADSLGSLGPYRLVSEIGRGSQGVVYKAVQPGTQRLVAVKRLAIVGIGGGTRSPDRFSREVEAATRLSHPNIVAVHAAEVIDGQAVIVMEWIDGPSVDKWADGVWTGPGGSNREKLHRVLGAFVQMCDAVSHAHQRGVIHRDLKPNNILVDPEGRPRVLDFGVAKVVEDWRAHSPTPEPGFAWTATGFAGTPAYCPPEQLSDGPRAPDTRADVYALGVILYRLASGEEAFGQKKGIADLLDAVRRGPERRPSQHRPAAGRELDCVVGKAMEGEPERRYQTVESLAADVRRLLEGNPVQAHPPSVLYIMGRAVRRRPRTATGIAAAMLLLAALGTITVIQAVRLSVRTRDLAAALQRADGLLQRAEAGEQRQADINQRLLVASMGAARRETFFRSSDNSPVEALTRIVEQLTPQDDDRTAAELRMRLAFALNEAGRNAEAVDQYTLAQQASDRVDDPTGERAVHIAMRRSWALRSVNRHDEALACIDRAITRAAAAGPRTIYSATVHWERLNVLVALERPLEEQIKCARTLVAACDEIPGRILERAKSRETLAGRLLSDRQFDKAAAVVQEAIDLGEPNRVDGQSLSRFRCVLGIALAAQEQWAPAEAAFRAAADYRIGFETATGSRAHRFVGHHAQTLHRLGRFAEAAARWELALLRPLADKKPNQRFIAGVRLRLAAARLGAGQADAGRVALALAISQGRTNDPNDATVAPILSRVEPALAAAQWQVDDSLRKPLGELAWMVAAADAITRFDGGGPAPIEP